MKIDDRDFALLTEYCNRSDNHEDNIRRARLLGFTKDEVKVAPGAIIRIGENQPGPNCFLGLYSYINGDVRIGKNVLIGPHCALTAGHHKFNPAVGDFSLRNSDEYNTIIVGDGCWLASGVVVTAGVTLGRGNLICANAVVTKDTEDFVIMAGTPAKKIGRIDPETGEYQWN